jgi:hypothetical protein
LNGLSSSGITISSPIYTSEQAEKMNIAYIVVITVGCIAVAIIMGSALLCFGKNNTTFLAHLRIFLSYTCMRNHALYLHLFHLKRKRNVLIVIEKIPSRCHSA